MAKLIATIGFTSKDGAGRSTLNRPLSSTMLFPALDEASRLVKNLLDSAPDAQAINWDEVTVVIKRGED